LNKNFHLTLVTVLKIIADFTVLTDN